MSFGNKEQEPESEVKKVLSEEDGDLRSPRRKAQLSSQDPWRQKAQENSGCKERAYTANRSFSRGGRGRRGNQRRQDEACWKKKRKNKPLSSKGQAGRAARTSTSESSDEDGGLLTFDAVVDINDEVAVEVDADDLARRVKTKGNSAVAFPGQRGSIVEERPAVEALLVNDGSDFALILLRESIETVNDFAAEFVMHLAAHLVKNSGLDSFEALGAPQPPWLLGTPLCEGDEGFQGLLCQCQLFEGPGFMTSEKPKGLWLR